MALALAGTAALAQDGQAVSTGRGVEANPQENSNRVARDAAADATMANRVEKAAEAARKSGDRARPAKAEELTAGSIVNDSAGQQLATIEGVEIDGVILVNGAGKVKVPLEAFGLNKKGLLLDVTKDQFDQLVTSAVGPAKS
jgi:hypothetical protein